MQRRVRVSGARVDDPAVVDSAKFWTSSKINEWTTLASRHGLEVPPFTAADSKSLTAALEHVRAVTGEANRRVLVFSSGSPWLEACLLAFGAQAVVSVQRSLAGRDRQQVHPRVTVLSPGAFRALYTSGSLDVFDAAVSVDVHELGLGADGLALNPWADIISVAQMWCVTRPGGVLILAGTHCHAVFLLTRTSTALVVRIRMCA
jgi:hypothetical protein